MLNPRTIVYDLITEHAQKAHMSEYDRSVAILAMAAVRDVAEVISPSLSDKDYSEQIIAAMSELMDSYYDPDGEFTSGKSVIGSFLTDLHISLKRYIA